MDLEVVVAMRSCRGRRQRLGKTLAHPRTLRTLCVAGPGLLARDQVPCPKLGTVEKGRAAHGCLSISEVDDRVNSLAQGNRGDPAPQNHRPWPA